MPDLERLALQHCRGKILDIGAGAGSHALYLQEAGAAVTALDISPLNVAVMQQRGVKQVICADILSYHHQQYDTLLLLMNGIGLAGSIAGLRSFLRQADRLLLPGGQLLFDSSDIAYLWEDRLPPANRYYGDISYRYQYRRRYSEWFQWLYIDLALLSRVAIEEGWQTTLLLEDDSDQYLVKLVRAGAA